MPIAFNAAQIQAIIRNLTIDERVPHNYFPFQLQIKKSPYEYVGCGFNTPPDDPNNYDFDRDFNSGTLRMQGQTKTDWLPHIGAVSIGTVVMASSVTDPQLKTIAETLFPKINKTPIHMQMATEQMQLLQQAYNKSTYKSALYIIREIMQLLGFDVMLVRDDLGQKQPFRNLVYNPEANYWELRTRGFITLLDLDMQLAIKTNKATAISRNKEFNTPKIDYQSIATFCPKLKTLKNPPDPTVPPQFGLSKHGEHGFLLQSMQLTDTQKTPNELGLTTIFDFFVLWVPIDGQTFLHALVSNLRSKILGSTLSPDLARVLTGPLNKRLFELGVTNDTRKSAITKLIKLLLKQPMTVFAHSECSKLAYAGQTTNILLLSEILALNQGREYFTTLEPLIDPAIYSQITFNTAEVPQFFEPNRFQQKLPPFLLQVFNTNKGFGYKYLPSLIQKFITALNTPARKQEFETYGLKESGGYGVTPGSPDYDDGDYKCLVTDFIRGNKLQGLTFTEYKKNLREKDDTTTWDYTTKEAFVQRIINEILGNPEAPPPRDIMGRVPLDDESEDTAVKLEDSDDDFIPLEDDPPTTPAAVHLEVLKRLIGQTVAQLPDCLISQASTCLGLNWTLSSLNCGSMGNAETRQTVQTTLRTKLPADDSNAAKNIANIFYSNDTTTGTWKWYCETVRPNILFNITGGEERPVARITNYCLCSFAMPDLSHVDYSQDAQTIVNSLALDPKGFEVETMHMEIHVPGFSENEPKKYLELIFLFFNWVISQDMNDRQTLLNYMFHFNRTW